jgi:uncharacterized protein (TIGR00369 family)
MDNESDERIRRQRALQRGFEQAPMRQTTGMVLHYDDRGSAVFEMPFKPELTHALGDTHGGFISALIDNAGWFTAAAHYDFLVNTLEYNVKLLERAKKETLIGKGKIIRVGKNFATTDMEVKSESGRLIAVGTGTFSVTTVPFDF